ncbi:hypothetical protein QFZ63_001158 [Streptomyces sp. B3I7]|nr:hypothetical protein [Streptomyces sp. B3I7]
MGGTLGVPVRDGAWTLGGSGDAVGGHQVRQDNSVQLTVGHDQLFIGSGAGQRSEVFRVPAELALDLYEGPGQDPAVRFAHHTVPAPYTPPGAAPAAPAGPPPDRVSGDVWLSVPTHRTRPGTAPVAVPPAAHTVRAATAADEARRELTDAAGTPLPGTVLLPDDAMVEVFGASAALDDAFRQILGNTYPGHPARGLLDDLRDAASEYTPDLVARAGRAVGESLAGARATDPTTVAAEMLSAARSPVVLPARAHQVFKGAYVVEGISLPGLAADEVITMEIRGVLRRPRADGDPFPQYYETGLSAADGAAQQRGVVDSAQFAGGFQAVHNTSSSRTPAADQAAGNDFDGVLAARSDSQEQEPGDGTPQPAPQQRVLNPGARYTRTARRERSRALASSTAVYRTATESGDQHRITADATLLVTFRRGRRNAVGNALGQGEGRAVTVAVDLPDGVRFLATPAQIRRDAPFFASVEGLTVPPPVVGSVPLPRRFVAAREVGFGSVQEMAEFTDATRTVRRPDVMRRRLLDLVDRAAPGSTRPGHASYLPGVAARIADLTSTAGLRTLAGRGPGRGQLFRFRHAGYGGAQLVEVVLRAEPDADDHALRALRGHPSATGAGIEQFQAHAPSSVTDATARSVRHAGFVQLQSRFPRPSGGERTDRAGALLTAETVRGNAARATRSAENRFWQRTDSAVDFEGVPYRIVAEVRVSPMTGILDLPGSMFQHGILSLTEADTTLADRIAHVFRGREAQQTAVHTAAALRFTGSETGEPAPPETPLAAGLHRTRPAVGGQRIVPAGPAPVFAFDGGTQLATALTQVAPELRHSWQSLAASDSADATAVRVGELLQAGTLSLDRPRVTAGLTTRMPGTYPLQGAPGTPPRLTVELFRPRPVTDAGDVTLDRLRLPTVSTGSSSYVGTTGGLAVQGGFAASDDNRQVLGFTLPVLARQAQAPGSGAAVGGTRRDWLKQGNTAAAEGTRGSRSHEILVDALITVHGRDGDRYVTGTVRTRTRERDVLGFGVTAARTDPGVYDGASLLRDAADAQVRAAGGPDDARADGVLRDWRTVPLRDLPGLLADGVRAGAGREDPTVQLWLAVDGTPQQTARALYAASGLAARLGRTVELALRDGDGLRFRRFGADGEPVPAPAPAATPSAAGPAPVPAPAGDTGAWAGVRAQIRALEAAGQAEEAARVREAGLQARMPGLTRTRDDALPPVARAATELAAARHAADAARDARTAADAAVTAAAHTDGQRQRRVTELTADLSDSSARARTAADTARAAHEAVAAAETALESADRALREATTAGSSSSRGGATRRSTSSSSSGGSVARRTTRRDNARTALTAARAAAENADRALDTARHAVDEITGRLELARGAARDAAEALERARRDAAAALADDQAARTALTGATGRHDAAVAARDAAQRAVDALGHEIEQSLTEQTLQANAQRTAQRTLTDRVALLETARAAAGDGTVPLPTASLASAPAAQPRRAPRPAPARITEAVDGTMEVSPATEDGDGTGAAAGTSAAGAAVGTGGPWGADSEDSESESESDPEDAADEGDEGDHSDAEEEPDADEDSDDSDEDDDEDEDEDEDEAGPVVPRGERPDSFVRSLAQALTASGPAPAWTRARDPHGALLDRVRSDVDARGVPGDAALPGPGATVTTEQLRSIGALTEALNAQSVLQGSLTVADAGLDEAARLALVLARPDSPAYVFTLAALVARETGRRIRVVLPNGDVRESGPSGGVRLTLYFDGDLFSTTPPAPDDE